jgi:hypothetical protein
MKINKLISSWPLLIKLTLRQEHILNKSTKAVLDASDMVGLEVKPNRNKYTFLYRHETTKKLSQLGR